MDIQGNGLKSLSTALAGVDLFASQEQWNAHWAANPTLFPERQAQENTIATTTVNGAVEGLCMLCRTPQRFALPSLAAGLSPNVREELHCNGCGLNARVRAAFELLQRLCPDPDARIYLTEQASPAFVWLQRRHSTLVGSEFAAELSTRLRLGLYLKRIGGRGAIRFEDVTQLGIADSAMDAVASFDVLEHVPDYRAALSEFARITRPGGWLVLTAPIDLHAAASVQRARLRADGSIEHLLEPEYHGDPLGQGVLSYHLFGWDLLDALRAGGYREAAVALQWNPGAGLYSGLATLIARR